MKWDNYEGDIIYELEKLLSVTTSDAQAIMDTESSQDYVQEAMLKGTNPRKIAGIVAEMCVVNN